jgi:hypothetical protein
MQHNFVSSHIFLIKFIIFSLTSNLVILNHKASLSTESNAFFQNSYNSNISFILFLANIYQQLFLL